MNTDGAPSVAGFRDAVDTAFEVGTGGARLSEMTLLDVSVRDRGPAWECFSLLFAGPRPALPQAIYALEHADLGSFALFLVPVVSPPDVQHYEAVFNRPTS